MPIQRPRKSTLSVLLVSILALTAAPPGVHAAERPEPGLYLYEVEGEATAGATRGEAWLFVPEADATEGPTAVRVTRWVEPLEGEAEPGDPVGTAHGLGAWSADGLEARVEGPRTEGKEGVSAARWQLLGRLDLREGGEMVILGEGDGGSRVLGREAWKLREIRPWTDTLEDFEPWFYLCDPWVDLQVFPRRAAPGEPITLSVDAVAVAGVDSLWWWGENTGLPGFDKAHWASGGGVYHRRLEWTVTIPTPGTYTFGANARDLRYWTDPGRPHQASEGCGIDRVTVEVDAALAKSYTLGFVLLTEPGTDLTSAAFQDQLARVENARGAVEDRFSAATQGDAAVDASYPVMVLRPTASPVGLPDDPGMYSFVEGAVRDHLSPHHPDGFDFLAVYETYDSAEIGSRHYKVRTAVAGLGIRPKDDAWRWGRGRLQAVGLVTDTARLTPTYDFDGSEMQLLLHETFGHQWGVFMSQVGDLGSHFQMGLESPTFTVLYGRPWRELQPGVYTTADVRDPVTGDTLVTFHPWVQYLAGIKPLAQVPASLMMVAPDNPPRYRHHLVTTSGSHSRVWLRDLILAHGDRQDIP
jgi:hypothetical protein